MADNPSPHEPSRQAPDNKPVPVSPSEPVSNEHLPPNFPIDELARHLEARLSHAEISRTHSGPLPDVESLRGYAEIIPDGAERIMKMAEQEQSWRHSVT